MDNPTAGSYFNTSTGTILILTYSGIGAEGLITGENIVSEFYDDQCKTQGDSEYVVDAVNTGILDADLGIRPNPVQKSDGSKDIVLALDIVTKDFVSDTQLFNGVTSNLCVRTSIGYGGDAGSFMTLEEQKVAAGFQEVNFIETLVTINYNFGSTITVSGVNVVPVEKGATTV